MSKGHTIRIRDERWDAIEKKAWQLSLEAGKPIKPTDVADAIIYKGIKDITIADVKMAKETR